MNFIVNIHHHQQNHDHSSCIISQEQNQNIYTANITNNIHAESEQIKKFIRVYACFIQVDRLVSDDDDDDKTSYY